MVNPRWEQAELTDAQSRIGRVVPSSRITIPAWLKLSPDRREITWDSGPADATVRVRHTESGKKMLDLFAQLWKQKPESVLRYAKRWGVLYLDKRGRPCQTVGPFERREPLEAWRYFSRRAQAVLNIAANLKLGELGAVDDWDALRDPASHTGDFLKEMDRYAPFELTMVARIGYPFVRGRAGRTPEPRYKRTVALEIALLSVEATLWLKLSRVGFVVHPMQSGWHLAVDYNECMLSAIALQLALVLADVTALYSCDGCHRPYPRQLRAPKPGQANFCDTCGVGAARRLADEKRRHKMSEAKRLARDGVSPSKIAKRLNSRFRRFAAGSESKWRCRSSCPT